MKLPGLKSRVSWWPPGFAGLPTVRSGHHSSPSLKARGFLEDSIKIFLFYLLSSEIWSRGPVWDFKEKEEA
jgi:hypothetical protein